MRILKVWTLVMALIALTAAVSVAGTPTKDAYYSSHAYEPQSKSAAAMRTYLAVNDPGYDLQSYCFFGVLKDRSGLPNAFATMVQRLDYGSGDLVVTPTTEGVMFNNAWQGGYTVGGIAGVPELTVPLSLTSHPWSARSEGFSIGEEPTFIDIRVVRGQVGQRGAVYEFTAEVTGENVDTQETFPFSLYVRAKDPTGLFQWGYGPSGFFPQWIYPDQRDEVLNTYGGSVGRYLRRTNDPMLGQGDYYYSAPLLDVQRFRIERDGQVVSTGRDGRIWFDNVTQSFDGAAQAVVGNGVKWTEFSVQLAGTDRAMKLGEVTQDSVGTLPYAMLVSASGPTARNGNRTTTTNWPIDEIDIEPVESSLWTSPNTGEEYTMAYRVHLGDGGGTTGHLVLRAAFDDQEVIIPPIPSLGMPERVVYEGLFRYHGRLDGRAVAGWAWGEIQPTGSL